MSQPVTPTSLSERYGPDPDGILLRVAKSFWLAVLLGAGLGGAVGVISQFGGMFAGGAAVAWALVGLGYGAAAGAIVGFCAGLIASAVALVAVTQLSRLRPSRRAGVLGAASALGAAVPVGFVLVATGAAPIQPVVVAVAIGVVIAAGAIGWVIVARSERRAAGADPE
jgi:hypothetical protein